MDLQQDLDPEDWRAVMDRFFQILCEGVHRFEGTVTRFMGDGIMALFGAPIAHEDHARRACYAALHLLETVGAYSAELRRTRGLNFSVRTGLNSGEVVVGGIGEDLQMDYTAIGHTVGLAQRMEALAAADKVYLTENTARLVEGFFELGDLGTFDVKGVAEPVAVYELQGTGPLRTRLDQSKARGFSKFVGRIDEMAVLESALKAASDGGGAVVGVVGEPGVGKSRLCYEFALKCRLRNILVRQAVAPAHGMNVPFLLVLELLRDTFGITERDSDLEARKKVAGQIVLLDTELVDSLPLIFDFLGIPDPDRPVPSMDPEVRQRNLQAIFARLSQARGKQEPRVTLLEDLHWADPASERILADMVEMVPGSRLLLVTNFRPEYHAAWMQKSYYRQVPLEPLGPDAIKELMTDLLGNDPSVAPLAIRINERSAGNPFFIEEVVHSLDESGALDGERGAYRLAGSVDTIAIPQTVQSVLAARIDRLGEVEKALLQTASVVGFEFTESILERVADLDRPLLEDALRILVGAEFLYETSLYPEPEYSFKHPLTQEVAYNSLLVERRRALHALVAEAIEAIYSDKLDERYALLAGHWEAAEDFHKAALWSRRAAEWVGARNRIEAVDHWRRVMELLDRVPESHETIDNGIHARAMVVQLGSLAGLVSEEEAARLYTEGAALAHRIKDVRGLANLEGALGLARAAAGKVLEGIEHRRESIRLADTTNDDGLRAALRVGLAIALGGVNPLEVITITDEVLAITSSDPAIGRTVWGSAPALRAMAPRTLALLEVGRIEDATRHIEDMQRIAREFDDTEGLGLSMAIGALIDLRSGFAERGLARALQGAELLERGGTPFFRIIASNILGTLYVELGRWDEAGAAVRSGLELIEERRVGVANKAVLLAMLAESYLATGRFDEACATTDEAVAYVMELGTPGPECRARIARARAYRQARSDFDTASGELARALEIVQEHGHKMTEPFVRLEIAELAGARGDEAARTRELKEAHRLFTEMGLTKRAEEVAALTA